MQYKEMGLKRIFVLRLEHGEIIHETIEKFAKEKKIENAAIIILGGIDKESKLVVGPEDGDSRPVIPMLERIKDVREICGTGTIFLDEDKNPLLHMHMATGRNQNTITGCIRRGVKTWEIIEVILFELQGSGCFRKLNKELGFKLLEID